MPRLTELVGYQFAVVEVDIPVTENGQIVHNGQGQPKTTKGKQIIFFDPLGDQIKVTLTEEGRQDLIRMLTGGIVVPG